MGESLWPEFLASERGLEGQTGNNIITIWNTFSKDTFRRLIIHIDLDGPTADLDIYQEWLQAAGGHFG